MCWFCVKKDGDGPRDRSTWPMCLLWHGCLPRLGFAGRHDTWAASLGQLAARSLEQHLRAYLLMMLSFGLVFFSGMLMIWPLGWLLRWKQGGLSCWWVRGCWRWCTSLPEEAFRDAVWETVEEYGEARLERCVPLCPFRVHSKRCSVLSFGVRSWPCRPFGLVIYLCIDNLNLVRSVRSVAGP